jgi:hypothetical protein
MRRARPYRGENHGPGKDVQGELDPTPGIREQPGSKADVGCSLDSVRLGPFSDSCTATRESLFDHLVRAREKGRRDFHAERSCGLEINDERVLVGLLNGKVGWFRAFQNSIHIMGSKPGNG